MPKHSNNEMKKNVLEALKVAIEREDIAELNDYSRGKVDGLKYAILLINMVTNPAIKTANPIDIIIDDIPIDNLGTTKSSDIIREQREQDRQNIKRIRSALNKIKREENPL